MPAIPFAFSVHHFISSVGADAGFAAIIGLAILVLLLFAQARETASLRQRAAAAEEQLQRLELYVQQLARRPAVAQAPPVTGAATAVAPPPASALAGSGGPVAPPPAVAAGAAVATAVAARAVVPSGGGGAWSTIPAAPAGVGAPALAAATRLIPAPDPISIRALQGPARAGAAVGAGAEAPALADGAEHGGAEHGGAGAAPAAVIAPAAAPAIDPAAPAIDRTAPPPATVAVAGNGTAPPLGSSGARPPARMRLRDDAPAAGKRTAAYSARRDYAADRSSSRVSRAAIAIVTALVVVVLVVVLLFVTGGVGGGTNSTPAAAASHPSANAKTTTKAKAGRAAHGTGGAIAPSSVGVTVLNGTSTAYLGHDVMAKLAADGYKQAAAPGNAPDQTFTTTIVGYLPGFDAQALAVAKSLDLGQASVQAVDQSSRAVACGSASGACTAQVIVTVGADLSSLATSAAASSSSSAPAAGATTATTG